MRSLWRILALQWLRGDGSEALTGDSTILEGLPYGGNVRCRGDRVDLESSGDAVLRHQGGVSTSPWLVVSVRQSGTPAPPRRDDEVIDAGADQSEALSRGASHDQ
jgi:hypothetical protein